MGIYNELDRMSNEELQEYYSDYKPMSLYRFRMGTCKEREIGFTSKFPLGDLDHSEHIKIQREKENLISKAIKEGKAKKASDFIFELVKAEN